MKTLSYPIYFIFLSIFIAQDYIWPTNASNTITAFFAEERPQRYHAGIDIRTYGKNGLEIYAIEDGYIERIKTDYKGYGKTIYLKLEDGNTAVYAHLEKFYPELNQIVEILKEEYNSSIINHTFKKQEFTVKKGEIIGYTGDTGSISGPHLHFEIRNKDNISINPLIDFYKIKDTIKPIPKKIAFIPMNYDTKIDSNSDIKLYNIINGENDNEYFINDTISVIGDFGISLSVIDKINKQPFTYGLYKIELYLDGELKYKIKYDNHNFNEGHIVNQERNYYLKRTENERFYNLYRTEQELSFIDNRSWPYYKLKPGIHNLVIKASDINNNEIIIFGSLISEPIKPLLFEINEKTDLINIKIDEQDDNNKYIIKLCNKYNGETKTTLNYYDKNISINKSNIIDPFNCLHIYGKKNNGLKTKVSYNTLKNNNNAINGKFKIKSLKEGIIIQFIENEFTNTTATINLKTNKLKPYATNRIEQNILSTEFIHYKDFENLEYIEIEYDSNPKIKIKKKINSDLFIPNKGIYITNKNLTLNSYDNFISDSTLIWIEEIDLETPKNSQLILKPYIINPSTLLFEKPIELNFKYPKKEDGIGIYYYLEKQKKWIYMDTHYSEKNYSTLIESNEVFALIQELNPPTIKNLIPDINAKYRAEDIDKIEFYIEDDLSGISNINNISLKIDDIPILFEYNLYQNKIFYNFQDWLSIGEHSLEIEVQDNVGNKTYKKGTFIIQ